MAISAKLREISLFVAPSLPLPLFKISQAIGGFEEIAVDTSGKVYVSNSSLNNIRVYNSSRKLIKTLD